MRKFILSGSIIWMSLFFCVSLSAQVTITGPTCAVPGTVYQYTITGNWDSTSTMNVCIHGGAIADSVDSNECTPIGVPVSKVLVDWDTSGSWSLSVSSSKGNATLSVSVTTPLLPGHIDSALRIQYIDLNTRPSSIICAVDTGGSCNPVFSYQWQQSLDMMNWSDISGATNQNLEIDSTLSQSVYFRRKVIEVSSGTIGYSDVATVLVGITLSFSHLKDVLHDYCFIKYE